MTTISLLDRLGAAPAGRTVAGELRAELEAHAARGPVVLDLTGVEVMAPSFADELFAKLDAEFERSGRIAFRGLDPALEPLVRMVRRRRPAPA